MILGLSALAAARCRAAPAAPACAGRAAPAKVEKPRRTGPNAFFSPSEVASRGSVRIGGRSIPYRAVAGTIVVHAKDWSDTDWLEARAAGRMPDEPKPEASMFYVAYFRDGVPTANRPITFVFNGGPGSSSIWLHMGAFGPMRVETRDPGHTRRPIAWSTTTRACSTSATWCSSMRPARASAGSRARTRTRPSGGRPGHRRLRPVHHPFPVAIWPLLARPNM